MIIFHFSSALIRLTLRILQSLLSWCPHPRTCCPLPTSPAAARSAWAVWGAGSRSSTRSFSRTRTQTPRTCRSTGRKLSGATAAAATNALRLARSTSSTSKTSGWCPRSSTKTAGPWPPRTTPPRPTRCSGTTARKTCWSRSRPAETPRTSITPRWPEDSSRSLSEAGTSSRRTPKGAPTPGARRTSFCRCRTASTEIMQFFEWLWLLQDEDTRCSNTSVCSRFSVERYFRPETNVLINRVISSSWECVWKYIIVFLADLSHVTSVCDNETTVLNLDMMLMCAANWWEHRKLSRPSNIKFGQIGSLWSSNLCKTAIACSLRCCFWPWRKSSIVKVLGDYES